MPLDFAEIKPVPLTEKQQRPSDLACQYRGHGKNLNQNNNVPNQKTFYNLHILR